jgi:electron transport complex protein RnfG
MPVIVLVAICLAVALLLAGINMFTAPEIERRKQEAIDASFKVVLPEGKNFEKIETPDGVSDAIDVVYKADGGFVFELTVKGKEMMTLMCGVNSEGKITGVEIISEKETPGYKEKILPFVTGKDGKYNGMDRNSYKPEVVSGATLSSNAIAEAVRDSLNGYALLTGGTLIGSEEKFDTTGITDTTVEEALAIAKELTGKDYEPIDKDKDMPNTVRSVFRQKDGKGYAFHIATRRNKWSPIETEGIVTADKNGTITGVKMLQWVVGYNKEVTDKAPEMTVEILNSYVGRNKSNIDMVDHATHATESSDAFKNSVRGALEVTYPAKPYTVIGIIVISVSVLGFVAYLIVPKFIKRRKI